MTSSDETQLGPEGTALHAARVGVNLQVKPLGAGLRIGIACGTFNGGVTNRLLDGALVALRETGVAREDVAVAWAPGAFELPLVAKAFCARGVDAVICLGAVIRGDTPHFEYVAGACATGITEVALSTGIPVIFGVLTVDTVDQALERCVEGRSNKGYEVGLTAVEMATLLAHSEMR